MQFTIPGSRHSIHHTKLLQKAGAGKVLRKSGAATLAPIEAKIYSKVVGSYLEHSEDTK